jgi:hypothetical protein
MHKTVEVGSTCGDFKFSARCIDGKLDGKLIRCIASGAIMHETETGLNCTSCGKQHTMTKDGVALCWSQVEKQCR